MLPDGRRLEVRDVRPEDADGLEALFAQLPQGDRYLRFFTGGKPPREFVEAMASQEPGSVRLVAEVGGEIVAEASAQRLPDGDGELGITVAKPWRGWLGGYLLDVLCAEAAAAGMPNLEADVLVANHNMLGLVHKRAYAVMSRPDWTTVRIIMGSATPTPSWPPKPAGMRVLVETAAGHWRHEDAVEEAGMRVLSCPGPGEDGTRCPVLRGEPCALAAGADAVVDLLPAPFGEAVAAAHAGLHPGTTVCLVDAEAPPAAVVRMLKRVERRRSGRGGLGGRVGDVLPSV